MTEKKIVPKISTKEFQVRAKESIAETIPKTAGITVAAFQQLHIVSTVELGNWQKNAKYISSCLLWFLPGCSFGFFFLTLFTFFFKLLRDRDVQSFCFKSHPVSFQLLCIRHVFSLRVSLAFLLKFQGIQRKDIVKLFVQLRVRV